MAKQRHVAVITGASSGIGLETAKALAESGWHVIAVGRNPDRCARAEADIRANARGGDITMLQADLSIMAECALLAEKIAALTDRIDVLVNNAGGMAKELEMTPEGLEGCFAGNHLGPFLLTHRLLPVLRRAAAESPTGSVRIINTSSGSRTTEDSYTIRRSALDFHIPYTTTITGAMTMVKAIETLGREEARVQTVQEFSSSDG